MISPPAVFAWLLRTPHPSVHLKHASQQAVEASQLDHPQRVAQPELHTAGVGVARKLVAKPDHTAVAQLHLVVHISVAGDG
jgi:hypothetical protein